MLKVATKEFERKGGQPRLSQSSFSSQQHADKPASQAVNPGYRNPLRPSSASTINGLSGSQRTGGVKRSASGLAKAMDGSFDDDSGSRYQPVVVGGQSPSQANTTHIIELFDENDFDSDIELDIEEPIASKGVSYPKLPAQPTRPSRPTRDDAIAYPTLPKQHPAQTKPAQNAFPLHDIPSGSLNLPASQQAPDSSAQLPWSSSPVEHHRPKTSFQQYAFDPSKKRNTQVQQNGSPQAKPAKRRTLPWPVEQQEEATAQPAPTMPSTSSKSQSARNFTPVAKDKAKNKSMFPWNTTASAVKEQQKKHREDAKKATAVKKLDGTEESISKAKSKQARPARVFLSEEQQHVLELVIENKKSVFFTGSAGTGKSVLMREIISSLRRNYSREPDRVAVTASTGLAACNVGGVTLHSFAGIGLGKEDVPELVRKIKRNQKAKHRWMRTKVLVVDEVSMVDGELFDKLEAIARQIRNNGRPFGGIQLVITGDFFQLPPVPENNRVAKFAFDAATWPTVIEHTIGLHHVFRQKDPGK